MLLKETITLSTIEVIGETTKLLFSNPHCLNSVDYNTHSYRKHQLHLPTVKYFFINIIELNSLDQIDEYISSEILFSEFSNKMEGINQAFSENAATVGRENLSGQSATLSSVRTTNYADGRHSQFQNQQQHPQSHLMEWSTLFSDYEFLGKIGQGAFASVWRARCHFNERMCAIKVLNLEHVDTNFVDIRLEVQTMRLSSHPNVLACFTSFIQDTNLWLVTQLMDRGSSLQCIQSARFKLQQQQEIPIEDTFAFFEEHITYILYETILGLKYIHDNGQIHRDVKAGNILLGSDANVRIADFGVSGWLVFGGNQRENTRTFVGTPCWMAPEVMEQVHGYDYKADIWSLGITALELAKGYAPYARYAPMKVLLLTIQEDPPSFDSYEDEGIIEEWSASFRDMVRVCLQKDPSKRPNCEELLAHKHFKHLGNEKNRLEYQEKVKKEICDFIKDLNANEHEQRSQQAQDNTPIFVSTSSEENRAPGTTWVFSDGSQVLCDGSQVMEASTENISGQDDGDFFDEFERETQGENFRREDVKGIPMKGDKKPILSETKSTDKEDMNDFFDEFEKNTGGENFRKSS